MDDASTRAEPGHLAVPAPSDTPVLVVDDGHASLEAVERYLKKRGYPVQTFEDAQLALEAIERAPPPTAGDGRDSR